MGDGRREVRISYPDFGDEINDESMVDLPKGT